LFDDDEEVEEGFKRQQTTLKDISFDESVDISENSDVSSHYSRVLHPNEIKAKTHKVHSGMEKYFHRFDELIMKPIFIYKYEKSM
jgi:hypothetical protein